MPKMPPLPKSNKPMVGKPADKAAATPPMKTKKRANKAKRKPARAFKPKAPTNPAPMPPMLGY